MDALCDHIVDGGRRVYDNMLRGLGQQEVREVLREQGAVTVTCDFCNRPYQYDAAAVDALFAASDPQAAQDTEKGRDSGQALH